MLNFEYIQIEPTFNCNLLCKHCGRGRQYVGKEMSFEELKYILDQFKDYKVGYIAFSGGGEIFTHKKIEEMFSLIAGKGYRIVTVSNGTLLHKKDMDYVIRNNLLFHIILSLEGATRQTFELIRGESTFDVFSKNIKKIQELKKKWNTTFPIVTLNVVCMKNNLKELPLIVDFAKNNGTRNILFVHLNPHIKRDGKESLCVPEQHLSSCDPQEVKAVFQTIKEKTSNGDFDFVKIPNIEFNDDDAKNKFIPKKFYCPWIQKRTFINWEGFVLPCCQVGRDIIHFGNIFQNSFQNIWNSSKFTIFRENLVNGNPDPICRNCNEYKGIGFG